MPAPSSTILVAVIGHTIELNCITYGKTHWVKVNGSPSRGNVQVIQKRNNNKYISTLIIRRVTMSDKGVYNCVGEDEKWLKVTGEFMLSHASR